MGNPTMSIPLNIYVDGTLSARVLVPSPGSIGDDQVAPLAGIDATKLQHQHVLNYDQGDPTAAVVAGTKVLWTVRGATAKIVQLDAMITGTIATGADRTVTIDLKRSTAGGAFASIMTAVVFNNGSTLLTASHGSFSVTDLVAGDVLELTVAVAGAAGNQAKGLLCTLTVREDAN